MISALGTKDGFDISNSKTYLELTACFQLVFGQTKCWIKGVLLGRKYTYYGTREAVKKFKDALDKQHLKYEDKTREPK